MEKYEQDIPRVPLLNDGWHNWGVLCECKPPREFNVQIAIGHVLHRLAQLNCDELYI